ncbi:hypothetical protein VaNZ11_000220 [Volvox africanus]|uniref:Conserved oligomeric Golgi complex subunit 2 n=1 Tax=Volvox africanus TaxID=51714 RepID=A0ABQ5RMC6_9CHLO|nr:hypothetical protein VaNZ11_000220 [Volvox africanus]
MSKPKAKGYPIRKAGQLLVRKDDAIKWFQREGFDPSEFICLLNSEKELDQARNELTQLNEYCKQEVQKVVHAHHKDFLEASRNIQDVEVLVDELRNYVSGSVAVVANLVDLPTFPKQVVLSSSNADDVLHDQQAPSDWETVLALQAQLMQDLQVAVAEQDVSVARSLLNAGRDMIAIVDRDGAQLTSHANCDTLPGWRYAFESALAAQKAILIEELQRQLLQTNSSTLERRHAAQNLGLIVGPSQAAQALMGCHSLRVHAAQQCLLKQHSAAGGDPDGVEYAGGLAQRTFLAIGAAAEDVRAVFPSPVSSAGAAGHDSSPQAAAVLPPVSALVVQWASDEARHCAALLCRHALTPFVATGMAVGALLCVRLALVFCVALESSYGLALRVPFLEELWPLLEAIVQRHLHRLREEASASASVDATNAALQAVTGNSASPGVTVLGGDSTELSGFTGVRSLNAEVAQPAGGPNTSKNNPPASAALAGLTCLPTLIPELKALAEGLASIASSQAVAVLRQGVLSIFKAICDKVQASLVRLVGSNTGGGVGKGSTTQGALLAAYVSKAERVLRTFAEVDIQRSLEPLACVCGSAAPPELLLPFLVPFNELLSTLPEPALEVLAPAESDLSQRRLQPHQSGGIRVELAAEQDRRERDSDGRRGKDATSKAAEAREVGQTVATSAALPLASAAVAGASEVRGDSDVSEGRVRAFRGALAGPSGEAGRRGAMRRVDNTETPGGAPAFGQSVDQYGVANDMPQRRRLAQGVHAAAEPADGDGKVRWGIASEPSAPRCQQAQIAPDLEPEPWVQRQQRSDDLLVKDDDAVAGRPPQLQGPQEDETAERAFSHRRRRVALDSSLDDAGNENERPSEAATISVQRPRSLSRGHERMSGGPDTDASLRVDTSGRRASSVDPQHQLTAKTAVLSTVAEDPSITSSGRWSASPREGQNRIASRQPESDDGNKNAPVGMRDGNVAAPRRHGRERAVRFQNPATSGAAGTLTTAEGVFTRRSQDPDAHVPYEQEVGSVVYTRAANAEEEQEGVGDELPVVLPRVRRKASQPAQVGGSPQTNLQHDDEKMRASVTRKIRTTRREQSESEKPEPSRRGESVDGQISPGPQSSPRAWADVKLLPDEDVARQRQWGLRRTRFEQPYGENATSLTTAAAVSSITSVPGGRGRSPEQGPAPRGAVDGATSDARGAASDRASVSVVATSERANPSGFSIKPGARKPNRFGVVLSDDEDGPASAPKLRRPRVARVGAAAAAAASSESETQQHGNPEDSSTTAQTGAATAVAAAQESVGAARRERGVDASEQEECVRVMAEGKNLSLRQRAVVPKDADETLLAGRSTQDAPTRNRDLFSASVADPHLRVNEAALPEPGAANEVASAARVGTRSDVAGKPQTARERLAARMAAKGAASEELL